MLWEVMPFWFRLVWTMLDYQRERLNILKPEVRSPSNVGAPQRDCTIMQIVVLDLAEHSLFSLLPFTRTCVKIGQFWEEVAAYNVPVFHCLVAWGLDTSWRSSEPFGVFILHV